SDHLIDGRTGGNHHHEPPRAFERPDQLLQRARAGELLLRVIAEKRVRPLRLEIPDGHGKAMRLDVQRKIASHRPETDDAERALSHADTPAALRAALRICRPGLSTRRSRDRQFARGAERALEREVTGTDAELLPDERRQRTVSE